MDHASRSARGQVETASLPSFGPEDRLCEREPNKPCFHPHSVEQSNAQVSLPLSSLFLNKHSLTAFLREQGLGRAKVAETPSESCRREGSSGSPRFGQAQNGVLELGLGGVDEFKASKGGTATLRAECKHDKSVTSAYWDPRGRAIVSTSYDDTLRSTSRCDFTLCCKPPKGLIPVQYGISVRHSWRQTCLSPTSSQSPESGIIARL